MLTGYAPIIEKAITFAPIGVQQNIPDEKIEIFKGVIINPRNENSIEQLIEKRLEMKELPSSDCEMDKTIQNTINIIANTASYSIHIQVNSERSEKQNESVTVYGVDESFSANQNTLARKEIPAKHFNPILGVFLPAAVMAMSSISVITNSFFTIIVKCDNNIPCLKPKITELNYGVSFSCSPHHSYYSYNCEL